MIDTSAIDARWPVDADDAAREQPSLPLDLGESKRLARSPGGVLTVDTALPAAEILTISKSEIEALRRCARRYQYEYELGRTPVAGPGFEAEWGAALHRGLEIWSIGAMTKQKPETMLWNAISAAIDPRGTDADGRPYTPPSDPYAKAALRAMLRAYAWYWGPSDAERYEVLHVELPFDLPVLTAEGRVSRGRREGARREGRMDLVLRERASTQVWVNEHKSTGKPPNDDRWYKGLELDLQSSLYFDAARELGLDPAGVIYDVIRRPDFHDPKPPPQLKKDGEPRKQKAEVAYTNPRHGEPAAIYEERVYQLVIARPEDYFHRRALTFEPWQIEESREDVRAAALEIAWRRRFDLWPRTPDWRYTCGAKDRVCPWLDVCGRRAEATDDRLFPLKRKDTSKS